MPPMSAKHDKVAAQNGNNHTVHFFVEACRISRINSLRAQALFPDTPRTSGTPLFRIRHSGAETTSRVRSMPVGTVDTTSEI